MRYLWFSLLLAISTPSAFSAGPTENAVSRRAMAYENDDKWWKCDAFEPAKGCETGAFSSLGLSKEDELFVKEKLDQIAWHPKKAEKDATAKLLGGKASIDVGVKQIYQGVGVGADNSRSVSVYYVGGYVSMIHWFQPGRFLLIKAH